MDRAGRGLDKQQGKIKLISALFCPEFYLVAEIKTAQIKVNSGSKLREF